MSETIQKKRVVIKVGSSSLTSMQGELSRRKLEHLVEQVVKLKDDGHEVLLVSSGAVAAGYRKLGFVERPTLLPEKQAAAAVGQGLLIEAYSNLFLSHGYVASQLLITRSDFSDETRYMNIKSTMNVLLERGIIPIVNENDTVTSNRLKFGDNDTLSAKVAALISADQLIILSDIEGLYDSDPRENKDATLLTHVKVITSDIEVMAGEAGSSVGTGGMRSKLEAFKITMASGIPAFIGKSGVKDIVYQAVQKTAKGTYFEPENQNSRLDSKQQWMAFNSEPEGAVVINDSAVQSILNHTAGLYLCDIVEVKGDFNEEAIIKILTLREHELGVCRVNFSSSDLVNGSSCRQKDEAASIRQIVCQNEWENIVS